MRIDRFIGSLALAAGTLVLWNCDKDTTVFGPQDLKAYPGSLSGKVVDQKGEVVPSALVTLFPGGATTVTNAGGRFELGNLPPGAYHVSLSKADYRDTLRRDSFQVGLSQDRTIDSVRIAYRYATVQGVVDTAGTGLPQAGVTVEDQDASSSTMSSGRFTIRKVEPGHVRLFAAYPGMGYGVKEVDLRAGDTLSGVSVSIDHRGGTVNGTVVGASGSPVPSATVSAVGGMLSTTTDGSGNFALPNVPQNATLQVRSGDASTFVTGLAVPEGGKADVSKLQLGAVRGGGSLPAPLDGIALVRTTDTSATFLVRDTAGSDPGWRVRKWLWSCAALGWSDSSATGTVRVHPYGQGWSAGSYSVKVRSRLYKVVDSTAVDTLSPEATIALSITREDRTPPGLLRIQPLRDTTWIPWDSGSTTVSWTVSDDRKLDSVWLDGVAATVVRGRASKVQTLVLGPNTVRILARDSAGNVSKDSLVLVREEPVRLRSLDVATGRLAPAFDTAWFEYSDTLAPGASSFVFTPVSVPASTRLLVDGKAVESGKPDTVQVRADSSAVVRVTVASLRSGSTRTYSVHIVRVTDSVSSIPWNDASVRYSTLSDSRDGKVYRTVVVGSRRWMAQNLDFDTAVGSGSWCYGDSAANCAKYGRLYSWSSAMGLDATYDATKWGGLPRRGVCPSGWHVPGDADWAALLDAAGESSRTVLSAKAGWAVGNGTDSAGFRALPAGSRDGNGNFTLRDSIGVFWSSDDTDAYNAGFAYFGNGPTAVRLVNSKDFGFSLRCIEDSKDPPPTLHALDVGSGTLSPAFDSTLLSYADTVSAGTTEIVFTPVASSPSTSIRVNDQLVQSGVPHAVALGADTAKVRIVVSTSDTSRFTAYVVRVFRRAASFVDTTSGIPWKAGIAFGTMTDRRDGKSYRTVQIGSQRWMAQNLDFRNAADTSDPAGICYGRSDSSCSIYGRLYTWDEVMTSIGSTGTPRNAYHRQGICPTGWHVPAAAEWSSLIQVALDSATAGTALKSLGGWSGTGNGSDLLGFRALPGSNLSTGGHFGGSTGTDGFWWTATEESSPMAVFRSMTADETDVQSGSSGKTIGFSLRCIEDSDDTLSTLHSLSVNGKPLPAFDSARTSYADTIASGATTITVTPTTSSPGALVVLRGQSIHSGKPALVQLSADTATVALSVVNPITGKTTTYSIAVIRPPVVAAGDSSLASLVVKGLPGYDTLEDFSPGTLNYVSWVRSSDTAVLVEATPGNASDSVWINGEYGPSRNVALGVAGNSTTIAIRVKALDGDALVYSVEVKRAGLVSDSVYTLGPYSTPTTDTASTWQQYGISTYSNPSSSVSAIVPGGYVRFAAAYGSDGTEGYSANVLFSLPFTKDWSVKDMSRLDSIEFEYRNNATITDALGVILSSEEYSSSEVSIGHVYASDIEIKSIDSTSWKKVTIRVGDISTPSWWTDIPADYPSLSRVLERLNSIQFYPKTTYHASGTSGGVNCLSCVTPTMSNLTLDIRNVVFHMKR